MADWPEVLHNYDPSLEVAYRSGVLFRQWLEKYQGHMLFCDYMLSSGQIPHSGPIARPFFFGELLIGTRYLDAGYEALFLYRDIEDKASFDIVSDCVGDVSAAKFIVPNLEKGGRPPDLFVFHRATKRFRFVECKRPDESYTKTQPQKFAAIEQYLTEHLDRDRSLLNDMNRPDLFPHLNVGQWIHIVRFKRAL